jgi:hypothetical protein
MREMIYTYKILVRKLERERPCLRPKNRWEDNIKVDFKEMECEVMD